MEMGVNIIEMERRIKDSSVLESRKVKVNFSLRISAQSLVYSSMAKLTVKSYTSPVRVCSGAASGPTANKASGSTKTGHHSNQ